MRNSSFAKKETVKRSTSNPTDELLAILKPGININSKRVEQLITNGADLKRKNANGDNSFTLALKANQPHILRLFNKQNPNYFVQRYSKMNAMGLIGKEQGWLLGPGELDRTQISYVQKQLQLVEQFPTVGSSGGRIHQQVIAKRPNKPPTQYFIKPEDDSDNSPISKEIWGARLYAFFAGPRGTKMAKTRLIHQLGDIASNDLHLGSRWLDHFESYYTSDYDALILSIKDDNIIAAKDGKNYTIKGFIPMLVVARFIEDFDCLGWGSNAGFINNARSLPNGDIIYPNAKIDPAQALDFEHLSMPVIFHLQQRIMNKHFHTHLPIAFIDPSNMRLRSNLGSINSLEHFYPQFDTRDLLIGSMTYREVSEHPKLYHEMAKTIESIVNGRDEDLLMLLHHNMPNSVNGRDLAETQHVLFDQLLKRKKFMGELYAQELEYVRLHRELKQAGHVISFTDMKRYAARAIEDSMGDRPPIIDSLNRENIVDIPIVNELLVTAASFGNLALVRILLTYPHDIYAFSYKTASGHIQDPLEAAMSSNNPRVVELILQQPGFNPIKIATYISKLTTTINPEISALLHRYSAPPSISSHISSDSLVYSSGDNSPNRPQQTWVERTSPKPKDDSKQISV